jgi:ATP/ADP translocase
MNDNTFVQRLLRGVTTILRSRLLMAIFTYNALYASTTVLLSFQRAELVANRNRRSVGMGSTKATKGPSTEADTAFLANVNMASSVAIFALQASGLGASVATLCGPRGTLALMPLIRLAGVLALAWWHHASKGQPPNLLIFLVVDEATKIMNLAVAKPVRESLWRGLSNEARYEAKPIVDTLANRWGGGSAAFLVSFLNRALDILVAASGTSSWIATSAAADGAATTRTLFGFPPILMLCMSIAAWWVGVSADLGHIRSRIDLELKKQQKV